MENGCSVLPCIVRICHLYRSTLFTIIHVNTIRTYGYLFVHRQCEYVRSAGQRSDAGNGGCFHLRRS